jgi:cell filamentation protein
VRSRDDIGYVMDFADSTLAFTGVGAGEPRHRALIERVARGELAADEAATQTALHFGLTIDTSMTLNIRDFDDYMTSSGVGLKNRLVDKQHPEGIDDPDLFRAVETELCRVRAIQFAAAPVHGVLDYGYFKAIHRALFSDVYPWAGQERVGPQTAMIRFAPDAIGFASGDASAPMVKYSSYAGPDIAEAASIQFAQLTHLASRTDLNREEMFDRIAEYSGELITIHPFRDGNMRAQWVYALVFDEAIGYPIDTERMLGDKAWRQQTVHSFYYFQATTDHEQIREVMKTGLAGGNTPSPQKR